MIKWIRQSDEIQELINRSKSVDCVLLKHSTQCPVSSRAYKEFSQAESENDGSAEYYGIKVIEDRFISNEVASLFSVRHESPQLLVIKNGKVSFHDSHFAITKELIRKELTK